MYVSDLMTLDVFAVAGDTSLETAARLLSTNNISSAPVVSPAGKPIGIVTLSDLVDPDRPRSQDDGYPLFYVLSHGSLEEVGDGDLKVGSGRVADVMTPAVLSIDSAAPLLEAANRLVDGEIHRLLVVDQGKLVGIISSLDILRGFLRQQPTTSPRQQDLDDII